MPMFFLVPLVAGLATGYISKKCQDEVAYLTSIFTVLSLVLSLVLAPWQIQALLLIVVLASTNKFLRRN
ncbi:hypothetical protein NOS3756_45410 [Nostoc sp. NIES-3756]|uniref:hypothetical protein n=1 Tax=Nostoc sp. NIES-3756 TaxID=1751286 RepID=UPI00071F2828|nr:hypothetical protein [Nostoc sp. NIES-3756]BAT55553.1 hypothetical protein NOS3756_45410 [Nostoc sp. NIES-3756]BAY36687.1 hypothetical protein NIES2111_10180 [Nostoc sp. NIES-2111]